MQPAWMLSLNLKKKLIIFFFIFFNFIIKKNNIAFFFFNSFFLFKLRYFFNLNKFYKNIVFNPSNVYVKNKNLFQIWGNDYSTPVSEEVYFEKKFYLKNNNKSSFIYNSFFDFDKKFYHKLLDFFFLNTLLPHNSFFPRTGFFNMFFFKGLKGAPCLININKVMARWSDFFNLTLNLYLMDLHPFIYSSPFFKDETLSLNWSLNIWDTRSWKLTYPYFIFKANYFSQRTGFFYNKLAESDYNLFIISDCLYHYKNLYFFKKNKFYTIGLVSLNINPWIVNYPIIASSNSYLNQIFFLQSLVYSQKKSFLLQFFFFKKIWNYSFFLLINP